MGSDECDADKDEECYRRRMTAEAHLDYIYTQNHKPWIFAHMHISWKQLFHETRNRINPSWGFKLSMLSRFLMLIVIIIYGRWNVILWTKDGWISWSRGECYIRKVLLLILCFVYVQWAVICCPLERSIYNFCFLPFKRSNGTF